MPDEHRAILSAILNRRVPINIADERGTTPLMWAAFEGYPDAVQKLVEAGAKIGDTNKKGETTFDVAVKAGQREVLSVLLQHNDPADFNLDEIMGGGKTTALVFSASCGRADIISVLLQAGADPTIKDSRGLPPLLAAVRHGQSEAVSTLLRSDFCEELVTSSDYGKIPLLIRAVKGGCADVVSALLAGGFGTNVDQRDPHGATALHWACSKVSRGSAATKRLCSDFSLTFHASANFVNRGMQAPRSILFALARLCEPPTQRT
jgi:ankyrin repeat protein